MITNEYFELEELATIRVHGIHSCQDRALRMDPIINWGVGPPKAQKVQCHRLPINSYVRPWVLHKLFHGISLLLSM